MAKKLKEWVGTRPDADGTVHTLWYRIDGLPCQYYLPLTSGECARALRTGYCEYLGPIEAVAHIIRPGDGGPRAYFYASD
jgi:hypothetical protein